MSTTRRLWSKTLDQSDFDWDQLESWRACLNNQMLIVWRLLESHLHNWLLALKWIPAFQKNRLRKQGDQMCLWKDAQNVTQPFFVLNNT
jgi:hypothetical protein